jgi:hypothetical protein
VDDKKREDLRDVIREETSRGGGGSTLRRDGNGIKILRICGSSLRTLRKESFSKLCATAESRTTLRDLRRCFGFGASSDLSDRVVKRLPSRHTLRRGQLGEMLFEQVS